MRIQKVQNQNFGAIKITPQPAEDLVKALNSKRISQEDFDTYVDMELINTNIISIIGKISQKFNYLPELGKDSGRNCINILTKQDSDTEKAVLKELSDTFRANEYKFQAESISDEAAAAGIKQFEYESDHFLEIYKAKKQNKITN